MEDLARRTLRTPDAARYLSLSPSTLNKMRLRGDWPAFLKLGAHAVAYDISDLNAWMDKRRRTSTSDRGVAK
jgi:predicted DNA-binding transcriptional regulator AlpA